MKIYLDIDGVLLTKQGKPAEYLSEFLKFVTDHFICYWLSTHCKGDANTSVRYVEQYFPGVPISALKKILPTNWDSLKTEAINFDEDFIWIDDSPYVSEKDILIKNNCLDKLIIVDLVNEPLALKKITTLLKNNNHLN